MATLKFRKIKNGCRYAVRKSVVFLFIWENVNERKQHVGLIRTITVIEM